MVVAAALVRQAFHPLFQDRIPYATFFLAVAAASWWGGMGPGILSLLLGTVLSVWLFLPPYGAFHVPAPQHLAGLVMFLVVGGLMVALTETAHAARRRSDESAGAALKQAESLRREMAERERAEAALRESEERFRISADYAPVFVWISDAEGARTWFNRPWLEFTGRTMAEEAGDGWEIGLHPEDRERCLTTLSGSLAAREPYRMEYRLRRHDGAYHWILATGVPRFAGNGEFLGFVGSCIDIQDRRTAEEQRRELAMIVDASDDAILRADREGIIRNWNVGAERLYGYPAGEVVGRPVLLLAPPELHEESRDLVRRVLEGEHVSQFETSRLTRYGRRVEVSLTLSPIFDESGTVTGIGSISRDITEQKRLERELQARSEQVQTQHEELEAQHEELQIQHEELEAQHQQRSEFLAMLAHELRNPLAPITTAVEVLRLQGPADLALQRQREIIARQVRHLARMVDDLLEASRLTQGKIKLRKEPVELGSLVEQALQICQALVDERGHELTVSLPQGPVTLTADPTRIVQILCNLLNNAARYTEPGGRISLTAEPVGREVAIRVRDTGRGIPKEVLPRIFDLFVQAERHTGAEGGLGVGLTLVRSLVEMHGGTVEARSDGPGAGSEFIVRLPAKAESTPGRAPALLDPESDAPSRPLRVLIVDDNRDAADTLSDLITLWGHHVQVAYDGAEGLRRAAEFRPELVLLDIGLPGMDGYEVARRLQEAGIVPGSSLVALTGFGQEEDRRRALDAGFGRHLVKPADPEALRRILLSHRPRPEQP